MKKGITKYLFLLTVATLSYNTSDAQLFKGIFKGKKDKEEDKEEVKEEEKPHEHAAYHKANIGKVVFYNKYLERDNSSGDSESGIITERVIAGSTPFYFRAYFDKGFSKACEGCDAMEIKYTMGGVSITTQDIREELPAYYARMASVQSFYDYDTYAVGIGMVSAPGRYYDMYTAQEDAYRILLSKISDQIKVGASLTLKVEVIAVKDDVITENILATGEIAMKVTEDSKKLSNLNCRCGKSGMDDAKVIKDVIEAFEFQFDDVTKAHKVVLLDRDFTMNYDNSSARNVTGKGMWANIIYQKTDGIYMMVKRYIFYKADGAGFSDKATIGKHDFFLPVSPTCAM